MPAQVLMSQCGVTPNMTGMQVVLIAMLHHQPDSAQLVLSMVKRLLTEEGHLSDEQAST